MEISDKLLCLFSATVEQREDSYVIEVPEQELEMGALEADETYRVAALPLSESESTSDGSQAGRDGQTSTEPPQPPVQEGETRVVEIEDIGDQGDGITRVERGFVIIVPDTEEGERVRIRVSDVSETVAFGEVIERLSYYE
jgi:predicted RNA-binding protein with TRAM domain